MARARNNHDTRRGDPYNGVMQPPAMFFADEDPPGDVIIGGTFRAPSYYESYLYAAHVVLKDAVSQNRVAAMAIPILYLQRHALELVLKDLTREARLLRWCRASLDAGYWLKPPKPPKRTHHLAKLLKAARSAVAETRFRFPSELPAMVERLRRIELNALPGSSFREDETDPTVLRYSRASGGQPSFGAPIILNLPELQEQFERLDEELSEAEGIFELIEAVGEGLWQSCYAKYGLPPWARPVAEVLRIVEFARKPNSQVTQKHIEVFADTCRRKAKREDLDQEERERWSEAEAGFRDLMPPLATENICDYDLGSEALCIGLPVQVKAE